MQSRVFRLVHPQLRRVQVPGRLAFSTVADVDTEVTRSPAAPGTNSAKILPMEKSFAESDPLPGGIVFLQAKFASRVTNTTSFLLTNDSLLRRYQQSYVSHPRWYQENGKDPPCHMLRPRNE